MPPPLALFTGRPAFAEPLHVGRPNLGDRQCFLRRIEEMLDRRWFTNDGPLVREFEQRVADFVGVRHCVAMCNATVALEITARAMGLKGEVIVPSYTFVATAHALQWQEVTPVFCDIDPQTHNLDPDRVASLITPRTTGIIGVHLWGRWCAVDALGEFAERRGLTLLFDAAHAFGCTDHGRSLGRFGAAEVFSFHATKFVHSFEGGAVTTDDGPLADKLRLMRNFGFSGYDKVIYLGTNGKMSEAAAAMGLTSLENAGRLVTVNRRRYTSYAEQLGELAGLRLIDYDPEEQNNYQYIVVEVDARQAGLTRDELVEVLHAENVRARRYFYPGCHRMEPYRSYFPHAHLLLPNTEAVAARVFLLPTGETISAADIAAVGRVLRAALDHSPEVKAQLATRPHPERAPAGVS